MHATRAIASYVTAVEDLSGQEREAMLEAAREYNSRLANGVNFTLTDEQRAEYDSLLDITGTGIMGYVQITSIGVNLPVYHSVDEAVLSDCSRPYSGFLSSGRGRTDARDFIRSPGTAQCKAVF